MQPKRLLICTFVTLVSGVFSAYIGGQISLQVQSQKCETQPWILKGLCHAWVAPGAIWQGSTIGLGVGTVLGAVGSGLVTRPTSRAKKIDAEYNLTDTLLYAREIELTSAQRDALNCLLVLLLAKLANSGETETLSLDELRGMAELVKEARSLKQDLSLEVIDQLLQKLAEKQK